MRYFQYFLDRTFERLWRHLEAVACRHISERQIYIRSSGRVHFFSVSPLAQAICLALAVPFLMWVGYATGLVIFKDLAVATLDESYRDTRLAYEDRITSLNQSTDNMASALQDIEDNFSMVSRTLVRKQNLVVGLIARSTENTRTDADGLILPPGLSLPDKQSTLPVYTLSREALRGLGGKGNVVAAVQTRAISSDSRPWLEQLSTAASALIASLFLQRHVPDSAVDASNPKLRILVSQLARLRALDSSQTDLLIDTKTLLDARIRNARSRIGQTGIDLDRFLEKSSGDGP